MAKITQKDINDAVWKACDTFRGSIDPSVYKDYVLTMLFLKYLSDVHDDKMEGYLAKYNGDAERAKRAMQHERFIVPEHSHFKFLYDSRNEANIGELINIALADLEEANREKLYSEDGAGIFQNIDFNNSNIGSLIAADHFATGSLAIAETHSNTTGILNNMMISNQGRWVFI